MGSRDAGSIAAIPAVILAGGRATRMGGGDKLLMKLLGRPMLDWVLRGLRPQVEAVALNANGDPARFAAWDLPVLSDPVPGQPGPLAGALAAMLWARAKGSAWVLTVPGDTPMLPADLAARLAAAASASQGIAMAMSRGRIHPVVAVWPVALAPALEQALAAGERRVMAWATAHGAVPVAFEAGSSDPFANLNTPADFAALQARMDNDRPPPPACTQ